MELLEYRYPSFPGLNLSLEVLEAQALHSKRPQAAEVKEFLAFGRPLLEAQVVDAADSLAYDAHDVDDALNQIVPDQPTRSYDMHTVIWSVVDDGEFLEVHAQFAHTVNIDLINPALGPSARVALELTEESALALADAIRKAVASAPVGLASVHQAS